MLTGRQEAAYLVNIARCHSKSRNEQSCMCIAILFIFKMDGCANDILSFSSLVLLNVESFYWSVQTHVRYKWHTEINVSRKRTKIRFGSLWPQFERSGPKISRGSSQIYSLTSAAHAWTPADTTDMEQQYSHSFSCRFGKVHVDTDKSEETRTSTQSPCVHLQRQILYTCSLNS